MFSDFFIKRPRFAMVIAALMMLSGLIVAVSLPIEQYPNVTPPQIQVSGTYRGASAEVVTNTVAAPLEEVVNGVDGMIYMNSSSSNDGSYSLSVTFATGTDPDMALVKVQNRVQQATPLLPTEVTTQGLTVESRFSDTLGFIGLISPNETYSSLELTNYANANVKNILKRVPGMGDCQVFGAKYSMRVWLDPARIASLGLSVSDVSTAIASQNRQASIGAVGGAPGNEDSLLVYSLTTKGRLESVADFENIILRTSAQGGLVKLKDVARVELGAEQYTTSAQLNGKPSAMMLLSQMSGSNAVQIMRNVRKEIAKISETLPEDMQFVVSYDSTAYVRATMREIFQTLILTFLLVVFVCYLFLQEWRVTLVPVAAIPTSLLATFVGLGALGYTINILTLFGIVLVIGTVVDDAIVVVERVQFIMDRDGSSPKEATAQAMKDITGAMVATTLVFLAIFVPVAFMEGITGIIYRQFAVTIAFAVTASLVVALTLSPAMCSHILVKSEPKERKGLLRWFNKTLEKSTNGYVKGATYLARRSLVTIACLLMVIFSATMVMKLSPTEFIPDEDQGAIFAAVQLPEGATQVRTKSVMDKVLSDIMNVPGVAYAVQIMGYNIMGGAGENVASMVLPLDDWSKRETKDRSLRSIVSKVRAIAATVPEAQFSVFTPPAISGLGASGGLDMRLQSRLENNPEKLAMVLRDLLGKINQSPEFLYAFSTYTADTPHLFLDIDREKAEMLNVPVGTIFSTLQTYFGSAYINNINIGTEVNKVMVQSEGVYRSNMDKIGEIFVNSTTGTPVPLDSLLTVKKTLAPRTISRYNLYPSAAITIVMNQGYSTGQGMEKIRELAKGLPTGYNYEWSGLSYQQQDSTGTIIMILAISLLFAYLFLVAQYESWVVPVPVILSLSVAMLGALLGLWVMGLSISIYAQLGILLLIGLAAKNAILIVEFAKELHEEQQMPLIAAAAEAARERFRAVLMTAFTCVLGVLPMLFASGAGANSRVHVGTTMVFGMLAATVVGIFLVPPLYVLFEGGTEALLGRLSSKSKKEKKSEYEDISTEETEVKTDE